MSVTFSRLSQLTQMVEPALSLTRFSPDSASAPTFLPSTKTEFLEWSVSVTRSGSTDSSRIVKWVPLTLPCARLIAQFFRPTVSGLPGTSGTSGKAARSAAST